MSEWERFHNASIRFFRLMKGARKDYPIKDVMGYIWPAVAKGENAGYNCMVRYKNRPVGNPIMRQLIAKESPNRQYVTLSSAFDFFNRRLFEGQLPPAIITLHRKAGSHGYYSSQRFESRGGADRETDEIALNPGTFAGRTDAAILSTLVHEMTHHWQGHFGKPGRGRYHNHQWAERMEAVGLVPTDTGLPGGRKVGQRMTHYILDGGPFDQACQELLTDGIHLEWQSREWHSLAGKARPSKTKYTCPECGQNAWARPEANLVCGDCTLQMVCEEINPDTMGDDHA